MPDSKFADFVASQQTSEEAQFDWQQELSDYKLNVASLYQRIKDYLGEYLEDGRVKLGSDKVEVAEETYGSYSIDRLLIDIGRQHVFLEPIGTMLIGSKGRVDLIGPIKRIPILLIRKSAKSVTDMVHVSVGVGNELPAPPPVLSSDDVWVWKLRNMQNSYAFDDLDKENFLAAIVEASRR